MNFCKFYNKTMNWLSILPPEIEIRENVKEVNIVLGITAIVATIILNVITYPLWKIWCFLMQIISNELLISKCNK